MRAILRKPTPEPIPVPRWWALASPACQRWFRLGYRAAWHEGAIPDRMPPTTVDEWASAWRDGAETGALARRRVEAS